MKSETLVYYKYKPTIKSNLAGKFCTVPFSMIEIDEDGDVMLCGCQYHMPYVVGNIYHNSITDIWQNPSAKTVRDSVIAGEFTYCNWTCPNLQNAPPRPEVIPDPGVFPVWVKIDLDRSCNLKCPSCRETVIQEKDNVRITKQQEIFSEIINQASNTPNVNYTIFPIGSGEVFASRSGLHFLKSLIEYPHNNIQLAICTNGTLLWHHRDLVDKLIHQMSFTVSIDAATAETYALVRGGNWEELQLGIDRYQKNIQHFTFVVQEKNWHEIESVAAYADKLGKRVDYQKFLDWGHWSTDWWHQNNPLDRHKDHYSAVLGVLNQVRQRYPKCTFSTELINLMNKVK